MSTRANSRRSADSGSRLSDRSDCSRSTSRERNKSRSHKGQSDSYSSDYSDDFETETKSEGAVSPSVRKIKKSQRKRTRNPYLSDRSTIDLRSSATSQKSYSTYGNLRNHGTMKKGWKSHSPPKSKKPSYRPKSNSVAKHMLTAKQQEINDLQNALFHAKQKLESAEKENKLLKTLQHRQDKAIRKFENAENDLPRLISRNFEDQRVLKTRLRKTQETKRTLELKLNENNEEMQKMEGVLKRLKKMVYDKNLGERSELSKQLSDAEKNFSVAEGKVKELERKLDLTITSYTRQLNTERNKHKETRERLEKLHEDYLTTDSKLKEKERALHVSNIYTMRKKGSPEKALVPVSIKPRRSDATSSTQTDLALTLPNLEDTASEKISNSSHTSPSMNGLHSDSSRMMSESQRDTKTSIFLTANFESPLSSPSTTFVQEGKQETSQIPTQTTSEVQNGQHESDVYEALNKTEEDIKKLQLALKQKNDLLSKMQEIDNEKASVSVLEIPKSSSPEILPGLKSSPKPAKLSPRSKAKLVQSLLRDDENGDDSVFEFTKPAEERPKKPEREISFGSYAPSVGGVPARRKAPVGTKATKPVTPTQEADEPLFDLTSGKQNKKSDLLTQLFGKQDAVLATGSNSIN